MRFSSSLSQSSSQSSAHAQRTGHASNRLLRRTLVAALAFLCLFFSPRLLPAQQSSSIDGAVTDKSGAAIQNAKVTLLNTGQGTSINVVTNASGEYSIPGLEAGAYTLQIGAPGFENFEASGVILRVARKERIDAQLTIGAATTEVRVSGSDMGVVQTESPEISYTITGKQITQLVLNGRNFSQLVTLSPGVVNQPARMKARPASQARSSTA